MTLLETFNDIRSGGQYVVDIILDTLFPKECIVCKKENTFLCHTCVKHLEQKNYAGICPICNRAYSELNETYGKTCRECLKTTGLNGVFIAFDYSKKIEIAIHFGKYKGIHEIFSILGKECINVLNKIPEVIKAKEFLEKDRVVLIPTPLHKKKEYQRGYNQGKIISREIQKVTNWKVNYSLVKRIKKTPSQTNLSRKERILNMQKAFQIAEKIEKDKTYVIVDDILATGSTMSEIAKCLKKVGAKKIWGIVLAKNS